MRTDILLVGPFRRVRIGGIRSHVRRLRAMLDAAGRKADYLDPRTRELPSYLWRAWRSRIVHLHTSDGLLTLALTLWARILGKRVIVTVHGELGLFRCRDRVGFILAGKAGAAMVALNRTTVAAFARQHVRCVLQSAYLPLSQEEWDEKQAATMAARAQILSLREGMSGCFLTYAFGGSAEHRELYGVDALIELFSRLPHHALVILAGGNAEPIRQAAAAYANIRVLAGDFATPPLFDVVDALIRHTTSDGDSVIVREALAAGTRVFASDCVDRPAGVVTYPMHNIDALRELTSQLGPRPDVATARHPDILHLYDRLLAKAV